MNLSTNDFMDSYQKVTKVIISYQLSMTL